MRASAFIKGCGDLSLQADQRMSAEMRKSHGLTGTAVRCKTVGPPFLWRSALLEGPRGWWNNTAFGMTSVRGWELAQEHLVKTSVLLTLVLGSMRLTPCLLMAIRRISG